MFREGAVHSVIYTAAQCPLEASLKFTTTMAWPVPSRYKARRRDFMRLVTSKGTGIINCALDTIRRLSGSTLITHLETPLRCQRARGVMRAGHQESSQPSNPCQDRCGLMPAGIALSISAYSTRPFPWIANTAGHESLCPVAKHCFMGILCRTVSSGMYVLAVRPQSSLPLISQGKGAILTAGTSLRKRPMALLLV